MSAGYFVIVDPDQGEIAESRRHVKDRDLTRDLAIRAELEAAMGEGCSVEFVETRT